MIFVSLEGREPVNESTLRAARTTPCPRSFVACIGNRECGRISAASLKILRVSLRRERGSTGIVKERSTNDPRDLEKR